MKEVLPQVIRWAKEQNRFVMARVIQTWGSSPRPVGAALIISEKGEMAGSVSGGCVEGSVLREAARMISGGQGKKLSFGVSDEEAWGVGLTCGGKIEVYLQPYPTDDSAQVLVWKKLQQLLTEDKECLLITLICDGEDQNAVVDAAGNVTGVEMPGEVLMKAMTLLSWRANEVISVGECQYFVQVFPPRRQLLIIGAAHITADLVLLAKLHDFETIVIDPRAAFAGNTQFVQKPDRVYDQYPSEILDNLPLDAHTYAVILSHDPKIDDNALQILLRSKVAYIGALGSRKTHEKRVARLKQAGFSEQEISRIESPVGMDIRAQGAKEIALSIMGSVIKARHSYALTKN